jgi:NAD+ synthase
MKCEKVIDYIVAWLDDYCEQSGFKGFVIGVSGGIDSAVTSTLCARTGRSVLPLNLPIYQDRIQVSRASRHIDWLEKNFSNVEGIHLDLTSPFQSLEKAFPREVQDGLTMANTRSRLRMTTLYAFATHYRMLVAGTGNKVEDFGVGFYTKYGDGGVDISPIADLMKSEVYALGSSLKIIDDILEAPPTDGLWEDNRTDESQIGATYAELEWAMQYENGLAAEELTPRQKEVLRIYRKSHQANRHKMDPIPVLKIPDSVKSGGSS